MEINVVNISGKETGVTAQLSDSIFGIEPNDHAIYLDVKQFLANQRQGTHKAKQRNEIAGSTRKLYKQKGTGGARAGSVKSPLFNGGGRNLKKTKVITADQLNTYDVLNAGKLLLTAGALKTLEEALAK